MTYDGTVQAQTVASVTVDGLTVTYDVSGNEQTNAGNYTLTVTGNGNFTGTANANWSIDKRALTADMFEVTGSYVYTGAGQEAAYAFSDEDGNLTAADFGVSYSDNVNAGNGAVITFTATADGNYKGELSFNFTIEKAAYDMSGVSFENATYIYDGSEKTLTIERAIPAYTLPEGLTATEGDTLADVALPDGWNWADDTLSVGEEGDNSFTAVYTPADTANYQEVSAELTVSVSAAATEDAGAVPGGEETGGCSSSVGIGSAGGAAVIISAACALIFKKGKRSDL